MEKHFMPEQNHIITPTTEAASNGDPNLGPHDVRLEIKLSLLGQREILVKDDVSMKFSNALTFAARGVVVAAIESAVQLLVQNAVTRYNELVQQGVKKFDQSNQIPGHGSAEGTQTTVRDSQEPDFPDRLPPPPPKQ